MPSIQMYLDTADLPLLQDYLNAEIEIAVIARASAGYALVKPVTLEPNAQYTLWHLPSGDIPGDCLDADGNIVADPWAKWHLGAIHLQLEVRPGKYQTFVPRSSGVGFDLATFDDPSALGRSDFEWVGNKYSVIGKPASLGGTEFDKGRKLWRLEQSGFGAGRLGLSCGLRGIERGKAAQHEPVALFCQGGRGSANQRLKLPGAAILVFELQRECRRPRQLSRAFGGESGTPCISGGLNARG